MGGAKKRKRAGNILAGIDSIKLKRPGRVLVFETTGFELYGRIATAGLTPKYKLGDPVVSRAADFSKAVKEVKDQLKTQTRILPKTAVLTTPCASGDLLSLPVDPKKPRPRLQMAEMVRWELEELFVKLGDIWSLGAMLQGRGYITRDQRLEVKAARSGGPGGRRHRQGLRGVCLGRTDRGVPGTAGDPHGHGRRPGHGLVSPDPGRGPVYLVRHRHRRGDPQ